MVLVRFCILGLLSVVRVIRNKNGIFFMMSLVVIVRLSGLLRRRRFGG